MSLSNRQTISGLLNATGLVVVFGGMMAVSIVSIVLGGRVLLNREGNFAFPIIVAEYFWIGIWLVMSMFAILLVVWMVFRFLAHRISYPISQLTKSAECATISNDKTLSNVDQRLNEVHRLTMAFNRLLLERERKSEEIRNLSQTVLHDLCSPLVQICDEADLLAHGLVKEKDAAMFIQKKGRALLRIVKMNAEISLNYSGRDSKLPQLLNLVTLIQDVLDVYVVGAEAKEIRFISEIPKKMVLFFGHEIKCRCLIGNLLDNAVKYTSRGGQISFVLFSDEKGVTITIADTGRGILKQEIPIIFERFYRGTTVGDVPGTGLGLSLVHSIVMFYHGEIFCTSNVGKGTTFRIFLPHQVKDGNVGN